MMQFRTILALLGAVTLGLPAFGGIDEAPEPALPIGADRGFEALLPEETAIFVSVRDVPALLEKLEALPLGKVMLRDGFFEDLLPPPALDEAKGSYEKFVEPVGAILHGEAAFVWAAPDFETPSGFAVLADVSASEEVLKSYLKDTVYPSMDPEIEREDITIGDDAFVRMSYAWRGEVSAVFGVTDGIFVLVPPCDLPEAVVEALGERPRSSLAENPRFRQVERALSGSDVIGYVDVGAIDQHQKEDYGARGAMWFYHESWSVAHAICGFEQFEGAGLGISFEPGNEGTTICGFGSGLHHGIGSALTRAAPLKSLRCVDADACVYIALSLGSLSETYSDFVLTATKCCEVVGADPDGLCLWWIDETVEAIEAALGRDLGKEVLPAFGGEVAVAAWIPGGLDVPPAALLIEVKDKEAVGKIVDAALAALIEATGLVETERKTYEGVEIISLDGVPQVIPAVAFVGDFLVVATNASVIEDMIDTLADGPHLGQTEGYKRYVASIPGDAAVTCYVDTKRIFEFGWPFVGERMRVRRRAGERFKAIGELGGALSSLGVKVFGSEDGVTLVSRSANGGLAAGPFLLGVAVIPIRAGVRMVAPGPAGVDVGLQEGFEPRVVEIEEAEEVEPEGE